MDVKSEVLIYPNQWSADDELLLRKLIMLQVTYEDKGEIEMSDNYKLLNSITNSEYSDKYVGFADILGYSNAVLNSERPGDLTIVTSLMKMYSERGNAYGKITVGMFSDSIYAVSDDAGELIRFFGMFQESLLDSHRLYLTQDGCPENNEIDPTDCNLVRGGISYGPVYVYQEEKGNPIILGPAVVDAYRLESKQAIYPRIILSNRAISHLSNDERKYVAKDKDGKSFVDFYGISQCDNDIEKHIKDINDWAENYIVQTENSTKREIEETKDRTDDVLKKYRWLIGYLDGHKTDHR